MLSIKGSRSVSYLLSTVALLTKYFVKDNIALYVTAYLFSPNCSTYRSGADMNILVRSTMIHPPDSSMQYITFALRTAPHALSECTRRPQRQVPGRVEDRSYHDPHQAEHDSQSAQNNGASWLLCTFSQLTLSCSCWRRWNPTASCVIWVLSRIIFSRNLNTPTSRPSCSSASHFW